MNTRAKLIPSITALPTPMQRLSLFALVLLFAAAGCQSQADAPASEAQQAETQQTEATPDGPSKAEVQGVMKEYIQDNTDADGQRSIQGAPATFDYLHDGLKQKDGMHVSCADFRAASGDTLDIDYYVDSTATGGLEVAKVTFHKRNDQPVNEVLWTRGDAQQENEQP